MKRRANALTIAAKKGPLRELLSDCQVSAAFDPATTPEADRPDSVPFKALWDTGATNSAITQKVVGDCGLRPVGMALMKTARGEHQCETFLVNIRLPNGVMFECMAGIVVMEGQDVLLGMDVITHGDFSITNQGGNTVFSFRTPSLHTVDYVIETNKARAKYKKSQEKKRKRGRR